MASRSSTVEPSGQIVPIDQGLLTVRQMLGQNTKGLEALLGRFMTYERYCGAVLTLCRHNPDLTDATKASRPSLLLAVMRIAQLQLSPEPTLGQAYIIPRKGRAELQIGYRGYLALAYRSPLVAAVRYGVVGRKDLWEWRDGKDYVLRHEPAEDGWPQKLQDIRAAWAILETTRGGSVPRVMYLPEILHHKAHGAGSQPAWTTDPAAMAVKTVLGNVCRRGPFDADLARAFQLDALGEAGKKPPVDDGTALEAEFSVIATDEDDGEGEPVGALGRFKVAHGATEPPPAPSAPPEPTIPPGDVGEAAYLDEAGIEALFREADKLKVPRETLAGYLDRGWTEERVIPAGDGGMIMAYLADEARRLAKGKR